MNNPTKKVTLNQEQIDNLLDILEQKMAGLRYQIHKYSQGKETAVNDMGKPYATWFDYEQQSLPTYRSQLELYTGMFKALSGDED